MQVLEKNVHIVPLNIIIMKENIKGAGIKLMTNVMPNWEEQVLGNIEILIEMIFQLNVGTTNKC